MVPRFYKRGCGVSISGLDGEWKDTALGRTPDMFSSPEPTIGLQQPGPVLRTLSPIRWAGDISRVRGRRNLRVHAERVSQLSLLQLRLGGGLEGVQLRTQFFLGRFVHAVNKQNSIEVIQFVLDGAG